MTNNTILIIGGTGFIGYHLAKNCVQRNWEVTSLSLNKKKNVRRINGVKYLFCDLTNEKNISFLKHKNYNYIVNLVGYVNHANYSKGGKKILLQHFDILRSVVNQINKKHLKCFVNIGSSDEYGSKSAPQNEDMRELPISPYSFGKTASAHFIEMLNRTENFPGCNLRLFLTYGYKQNPERFIPQIIKGCLKNMPFAVSEGNQIRDFCYISDIVEGIMKALQSNKVYGKTYNLASGKPIKVKTIIKSITKIIGKGKPIFGGLKYRVGENMELYADISKIKSDLDWEPKVTIHQGLKHTINWYLNNEVSKS